MSIGSKLHRGLEAEDISSLIEAHDWIAGLADRSCDCDWNSGASKISNPCDVCQAQHAMEALAKVIDPKPRTLHPERLKNPAERIYFDLWSDENKRMRHVNSGYTLIEHLLAAENSNGELDRRPHTVSQHDMTIATTVIQWLGTNCGRCFIERAEKEIKARDAERSKFVTDGAGGVPESWKERNEKGEAFRVADSIASTFISVEKHPGAYNGLRSAILNAIMKLASLPNPQPGA